MRGTGEQDEEEIKTLRYAFSDKKSCHLLTPQQVYN